MNEEYPEFPVGQTVTVTATFKNEANAPYDPTTVGAGVVDPDDISTTYTEGPDIAVVGVGVYGIDILLEKRGWYDWSFVGEGESGKRDVIVGRVYARERRA